MTNTRPRLASWGMDGEPTHAIVPCGHQVRGVSRGLSVGSQIPIVKGLWSVGPPSALRIAGCFGGTLRFPWVMVWNIFIFTPTWGRFPFWLYNILQMGWNHQPDEHGTCSKTLNCLCQNSFGVPFEPTPPPRVLTTFLNQVDNWIVRSCLVINTHRPVFSKTCFAKTKEKSLYIGGGFKYVLFSPLFGEDFQFWLIFFKNRLKPPTRIRPGALPQVLDHHQEAAAAKPRAFWQ